MSDKIKKKPGALTDLVREKAETFFRKRGKGKNIPDDGAGKNGAGKRKSRKGLPVLHMGPNRRWILFLWILLILSIVLGIYNNFTAVDTQTIIEKETVEEKLKDTNALESFVKEFAVIYHSWSNTSGSIAAREEKISGYMTEELLKVNKGMVTTDCPTIASVKEVRIWSLEETADGSHYDISYSVTQELADSGNMTGEDSGETEDADKTEKTSSGSTKTTILENYYQVRVHMDESGNMVIIKNPTACAAPQKSAYAPAAKETDGSVNTRTAAEIEEFLNTFFGLYPSATTKELAYYVKDKAMPAINKNYVYAGLEHTVYYEEDGQTKAEVFVQYLDQEAKITQIFQYTLILQKEDNWRIVGTE